MVSILHAGKRGRTRTDWLDSFHSFSFNNYYDPAQMGFGPLRVLNDDFIAPASGFPAHPHRDMEIITYVLEGELRHRDSVGNSGLIRPFEIQRMRAGSGIRHSEFNASKTDLLHLLQIWIVPRRTGLKPGYAQMKPDEAARKGRFLPVVTPEGGPGTLDIDQDARMLVSSLQRAQAVSYPLGSGRRGYLHVAAGAVEMGSRPLRVGDAARIEGEKIIHLRARQDSELVLFDLP